MAFPYQYRIGMSIFDNLKTLSQNKLDRASRWEYIRSMKTKTSVTLSEDLLEAIDQRAGRFKNRSDFIETAVRAFLAQMIRDEQNARDLAIINRRADYLNQEAADVLDYQVSL
jgi:Arc/MetJ-type ribon-helix-helix transcriptional regulator